MTAADVKAIRAALGMTQGRLAEKLGIHLRSVQKWEGGERRPRGPAVVLLGRLADAARRRAPHRG